MPLAATRFRGDRETRFAVQHVETKAVLEPAVSRPDGWGNVSAETMHTVFLDAPTVRPTENERAIVRNREPVATFVHEPMVEAAQRHEVAELCFALIRPVLDVMAFRKARAIAAREATAAVATRSARAIAGGMLRDLRPMLSGSPSAPSTTPTVVASHASRRDLLP